jgi:Tfp pilus assembly protein FimV
VPPAARPLGPGLARILVVGALALVVAFAGAVLVRTPAVAPGASATTHVVVDGESMWSIAVAHAPAGEAATYVERLVAANGTAVVAPGDTVVVPRP